MRVTAEVNTLQTVSINVFALLNDLQLNNLDCIKHSLVHWYVYVF